MLNCQHIFRMITYSINAHPVIALMFSQTGADVLPRRDEGSDKPSATIEPHRIMIPTRTRTQAAGLKVRCRYHYTTAAHLPLHFPLYPVFILFDLLQLRPREKEAFNYNAALKQKFSSHPQVRRIAHHRHVPRHIYTAAQEHRISTASKSRK